MGVRDGALVVLPYGGGFGDGGVEDLAHKLAEVESLLGGVNRRVILGFTSGLGHTSLLFGLVADGPASESEEIAERDLRVLLLFAQSVSAKPVSWRLWSVLP
jgi:hypothetical protein